MKYFETKVGEQFYAYTASDKTIIAHDVDINMVYITIEDTSVGSLNLAFNLSILPFYAFA